MCQVAIPLGEKLALERWVRTVHLKERASVGADIDRCMRVTGRHVRVRTGCHAVVGEGELTVGHPDVVVGGQVRLPGCGGAGLVTDKRLCEPADVPQHLLGDARQPATAVQGRASTALASSRCTSFSASVADAVLRMLLMACR